MPTAVFGAAVTAASVLCSAIVAFFTARGAAKTTKEMEQRSKNLERLVELRTTLTAQLRYLRRPKAGLMDASVMSIATMAPNDILHHISETISYNREFFDNKTLQLANAENLVGDDPLQDARIILESAIARLSEVIIDQNEKIGSKLK